jgi:2-aminoadipate transaminase
MRNALAESRSEPISGWADRLARRTVGSDGSLTGILALANASGLINFSGGFPAAELFPTEELGDIVRNLIAHDAGVALQYAPSEGIASTRDAIADYLLEAEGHRPAERELMITSGGIDAVTLIAKSMIDPGDVVAIERPSYLGAVSGFLGYDAVARSLPTDADGLVLDGLAELIDSAAIPKVIYTIPDYQNPTGRTMSADRRAALIEMCRAHQILIVEDVAYRELGFYGDKLPSLWSAAPDVVMQIGTFSKLVSPGVRLGWAAGPAEIVAQLVVAKQNSDQCAGALGQRMVEQFLREGLLPAQLVRERALYRARGEAMAAAMQRYLPPSASWTVAQGGFFSWLHVPGVDTALLALAARAAGVAVVPGAPFFADRTEHEYLRLSFSRATEAEIDAGISQLATTIEQFGAQA